MPGTSAGAKKGWATRRELYGKSGRAAGAYSGGKGGKRHAGELFDVGRIMNFADEKRAKRRRRG